MKKKVTLYIAMSLDGFIARKNGSVDWLDKFMNPKEDYGYKKFYNSINTVVMGSTTYKQILGFGEFPYKEKDCFVFSKKIEEGEHVKIANGDIRKFIKKTKPNQKIWVVGGANLVNQFLKYNLIDEIIISIIPIILGSGIRLFKEDNKELPLIKKDVKPYKSGIVQIHYKQLKD